MEAHAVLERLRRLDGPGGDRDRLTVEALDAIAGALAEFQGRVEATARHYNHAWALQDVLAARRHLDESRLIVLGFLTELADG